MILVGNQYVIIFFHCIITGPDLGHMIVSVIEIGTDTGAVGITAMVTTITVVTDTTETETGTERETGIKEGTESPGYKI